MNAIFSPATPADPPPPPAPPKREDPEVQEAVRRELILQRKARGAAGNLLTSGTGDTSPAPLANKQLFGA